MTIRKLAGAMVVALAAASFGGCGGSPIDEGIEENVDMSKAYTPAASVDMMKGAGDQKKAVERAKEAQ